MKSLICFIAIIALTTQGSVGVNTPWGGLNVGWKKAAQEDLPNVGVNTPFGGLSFGWKKKAEDLPSFGVSSPWGGLDASWKKA